MKKFASFCQVQKETHTKEKWFFFLPVFRSTRVQRVPNDSVQLSTALFTQKTSQN